MSIKQHTEYVHCPQQDEQVAVDVEYQEIYSCEQGRHLKLDHILACHCQDFPTCKLRNGEASCQACQKLPKIKRCI